jgi:iron-sulfur cluster assembly protein
MSLMPESQPLAIQPVVARGEAVVTVTERAAVALREILEQERPPAGTGVRLAVVGGGCSGLQYDLELDQRRPHDTVVPVDDLELLLDPKSSIYLKGVTLDFEDGLRGRGFRFSNPNASNTCGCGESFRV